MKIFLTAALFAIILAVGSAYTLGIFQLQSDQAFTSQSSVRLPDHGVIRNLVGKDWRETKQ